MTVLNRVLVLITALWLAQAAVAQEFSGLARVDAQRSVIKDGRGGGVSLQLGLSQGVPYRLFTLDDPKRLVIDFQEVDWTGLQAETLLDTQRITQAQFGAYVPGWSRMILTLAEPQAVRSAALDMDSVTAAATLTVQLAPTDATQFAAAAGPPRDPRWDLPEPQALEQAAPRDADAPYLVVLDPGHGGLDPGAESEGTHGYVAEKELMLTFAFELGDILVRSGAFKVQLTRDDDYFVSLERRIALAHQAGADVFISLHADALSEGLAHGATVHVLSRDASDLASAKLAERHDRDDLLVGADLSAADDLVTDVMLDLARQETQPRSEALARALIEGMSNQGGPMNRRPLRWADFSVLKAADIPSVLIEIGFLSSPRDLQNLENSAWRQKMAQGIFSGLLAWREKDAARRALVRQ